MKLRWQFGVHAWLSGWFRSALVPEARGGAIPFGAPRFERSASGSGADPRVGGRRQTAGGPFARSMSCVRRVAGQIAALRLPRVRGAARALQTATAGTLTRAAPPEARGHLQQSALLIAVQEDERRRIAFDLHDGIGQSLSLLKMSIEQSVRLVAQGATREAEQSLRDLCPRIDEALAEVRRVAMELRPAMLEDLGLLPTLSWFCREFERGAGGIVLLRAIRVAEHEAPAPLHVPVFRIVQEALHNVAKHAQARFVLVRLERSGEALHLSIEDDGCGFEPEAVSCRDRPRMGLVSMRERAAASGASFRLRSAPGRGTTISVAWHAEPARAETQ